jgi:hypothetical protein
MRRASEITQLRLMNGLPLALRSRGPQCPHSLEMSCRSRSTGLPSRLVHGDRIRFCLFAVDAQEERVDQYTTIMQATVGQRFAAEGT